MKCLKIIVKLLDRQILIILIDRWKQEFDSEPKLEESKKEGRARTDEEHHLSVQDFNEIRLNEINTKGIQQTMFSK